MGLSKMAQGCAWHVWDELITAHTGGQGPQVFEKEKVANGTDVTLRCSQRLDEIIRVIGAYSLARKDVYSLDRIGELVANPQGYIARKEANKHSNLSRARDDDTAVVASAMPVKAGALQAKAGRAKKQSMNAPMAEGTVEHTPGTTAQMHPTKSIAIYATSNPSVTTNSGTRHDVRPTKRKAHTLEANNYIDLVSDEDDESPARKRSKPTNDVKTLLPPTRFVPAAAVMVAPSAVQSISNNDALNLLDALAPFEPFGGEFSFADAGAGGSRGKYEFDVPKPLTPTSQS
ncbi:hypothetical protein LTR95_008697 [Oleoguttula sp. CCFEE 5521]